MLSWLTILLVRFQITLFNMLNSCRWIETNLNKILFIKIKNLSLWTF